MKWGLCLVGGLAAFVTSLLLTAAVVSAYAITLSLEPRGQPAQERIQAFASQAAPLMGPILLFMTTMLAARRVARKTKAPALHGTIVGVVAASAALVPAWPIDLHDGAIAIAVVGAGWLAGAFAGRT
jgi:hypothetical protein